MCPNVTWWSAWAAAAFIPLPGAFGLTGPDASRCTANLIALSVAADGRSYRVTVPATGHSATYATKRK